MHAQLLREGHEVNHKRVERLMRSERLAGAHVRRPPAAGGGPLGVEGVRAWPDLVGRDFQPAAPNQLWCADLKQIPTDEGVLHLASVLDCFSRRIVGWQMGPVADAELVAGALEMAVARRRPGDGLVHHSDGGTRRRRSPLHPSEIIHRGSPSRSSTASGTSSPFIAGR